MPQAPDYYQLLHVHPDAPLEIIRASYRTLMQRLKAHPDLGGDAAHAAMINEAYDTLRDVDRRAAYDLARGEPQSNAGRPDTSCSSTEVCLFCSASIRGASEELCPECNAPLERVARAVATAGQRAIERLPRKQSVQLLTSWPDPGIAATSRDVSPQGMLLETRARLSPSQVVRVRCDLLDAVARVVHIGRMGGAPVVGLEFLTLRFARTRGAFVSARA